MRLAGHGSQCRDQSGDESDGLNETLCPCDFKQVCAALIPAVCECCYTFAAVAVIRGSHGLGMCLNPYVKHAFPSRCMWILIDRSHHVRQTRQ